MRTYHTPLDLVRSRPVEAPVVCTRPDRVSRANRWFQENFPGAVLYAVKANPTSWVMNTLHDTGARFFDVASLAEIELVASMFPDARMGFLHTVKSREAIRRAYFDFGIRTFAIDCEGEMEKILEETGRANDLTLVVRVSVSNDAAALSLEGKFGIGGFEAANLIKTARPLAERLGVSFHVGSQCMSPDAFRQAMLDTSRLIGQAGVTVDIVDVGGGFPSIYPGMMPPPMRDYLDAITDAFDSMLVLQNAELWCEPGRTLVAEGESLLVRVDLRKGDMLYINDGSYGALFDAAHTGWRFPVRALRAEGELSAATRDFRLYGPTCDAVDQIPGTQALPDDIGEGDYLEIGMMGAYGTAMATRFNGFGTYDYVQVADDPFASMFPADASNKKRASGAFIDEGFAR